jgi:hypothetical protein
MHTRRVRPERSQRVYMHRRDGIYAKIDFARTGRLVPDARPGVRSGGGGLVKHDSGEIFGWSAVELRPALWDDVVAAWLWLFWRWCLGRSRK